MSRFVSRLLGAAIFLLLNLMPSPADAAAIDFQRGLGFTRPLYSTCIVMCDTGAYVSNSMFGLTTTSEIRTRAEAYLAALYDAGSNLYRQSIGTVIDVAWGDRGQDQIVAKVSEPSTLLVAGVAFLMFARRARRDQRRTEI